MRIERIEVIPLEVPLSRTFHGSYYSMSSRATLVTRVHTDEGLVGESYNGDEVHTQHEIGRIVTEEIAPRLSEVDPTMVEQCWQTMLPLTFDILRDRRLVLMAMAAVDSALWDLVGKRAGMPLYRLWGGATDRLPIIAIGGYYRQTEAELGAEVEGYLEMGIGGCKMKVGSASPEEDAARFVAMRRAAAGAPFVLIADANQGYRPADAIRFARLVEEHDLRWFEEPVRWENADLGMRDVRLKTGVPVAAGQSELARADVRRLMEAGAIDVCNFDASWSGGPTEWRRVAGLAASYGVEMAHHEEPQVAAHLLASVSHGTFVEVFHPDRDPIFWNLIANRSPIEGGVYTLPSGPGLGLQLDERFIDRHRADR
ncbi:MAG TPA: mandelate racemase/muconate lactonizing enzyme family protein [Acidimicrobiia bacterium]|nr:mandelate racemase/muconate lactonizing enzyme family protein [Acidimicrobiia bacterium]